MDFVLRRNAVEQRGFEYVLGVLRRFFRKDLPGNSPDEPLTCTAKHFRRSRIHVDVPEFAIEGDEALANALENAFNLSRVMAKFGSSRFRSVMSTTVPSIRSPSDVR